MRQLAQAKEAEMNGIINSLESKIHWLTERNNELTQTGASTAVPSSEAVTAVPGERMAALEVELRKSKRAEQKLQVI